MSTTCHPSETYGQRARRLVVVGHVSLHGPPVEVLVGVPDGCLRGLCSQARATSLWKQPPGELSRPAEALPETAPAHNLSRFIRCEDPNSKISEMPDSDIVSQPGPRLALSEWATVVDRGLGIGEEVNVVPKMIGDRSSKTQSIGLKLRNSYHLVAVSDLGYRPTIQVSAIESR